MRLFESFFFLSFPPLSLSLCENGVLRQVPMAVHILGGLKSQWTAEEVGDGNINFVFIVKGPAGGVCVKQALPYVRCVGESWPLTVDRIKCESAALELHGKACPAHVPFVLKVDSHRHVNF